MVIRPAREKTMEEMRKEFDLILAGLTDPDQIAKVELIREFFCNPEFRTALENETAKAAGL